jgi:hypothetical protein
MSPIDEDATSTVLKSSLTLTSGAEPSQHLMTFAEADLAPLDHSGAFPRSREVNLARYDVDNL